ncbi:MAG TPA: autotransporter-associated beta strand repeat-containing protein, partial [Pirellulales bacterium]|nr:autotransporter-associated beta strand repeat-containing protein [Pirellulales bacterium]
MAVLGLLVSGPPMQALAAIYTWNGTSSSWSSSTSWTPSGPPGASDTAVFGLSSGSGSLFLGGDQLIGNLTFSSGAGAFTFDTLMAANLLTLGDNGLIWDQSGTLGLETINDSIVIGPTSGIFQSDSNLGLVFANSVSGSALSGTTSLNLSGISGGVGTISGLIGDGTGGGNLAINASGAGTWTLSDAANSYTGGTTISGGTLSISALGDLGLGGGVVISNNATLGTTTSFANSQAMTLGAAGTYGVGGGTLDVALGTVETITSPITGTGGLIKVDGGNLTLAAANTYLGLTQVKAGNLVLSSSPAATSSTSATLGVSQYLGYQGLYNTGTLILANGYSGFTLSSSILVTGGSSSSFTEAAILSTGNNTINGNIMFAGG